MSDTKKCHKCWDTGLMTSGIYDGYNLCDCTAGEKQRQDALYRTISDAERAVDDAWEKTNDRLR